MRPFANVDVLDFTQSIAGPACTQRLATLGANVVKVEPPDGDAFRGVGEGSIFTSFNLGGKRSLRLDLTTEGGREVAADLAERADVVVESFRPGVMERFDLDYESVAERNPEVVYCSITGFGQGGPYAENPAYDPVIQAMSGVMSVTGYADRPPVRIGTSAVDCATGANAAFLVSAALQERARTGEGRHVDVSLFDTAVSWMAYRIAEYTETGELPERAGTSIAGSAPNDLYYAADDEPLYVIAVNDRLFERLCEAIGREDDPDDERFASNDARVEHEEALREELESAFRSFDREELHRMLADAGVPAGPLRTIAELADEDPHVSARDLLASVHNPTSGGEAKTARLPGRTDEGVPDPGDGPPALGEHSRAVLSMLDYSEDRIEALFEQDAVHGPR
jgi:crotonobetainyl-CoA:carnitine CoA-transferase CaiB-like acyl-CoA transferase